MDDAEDEPMEVVSVGDGVILSSGERVDAVCGASESATTLGGEMGVLEVVAPFIVPLVLPRALPLPLLSSSSFPPFICLTATRAK